MLEIGREEISWGNRRDITASLIFCLFLTILGLLWRALSLSLFLIIGSSVSTNLMDIILYYLYRYELIRRMGYEMKWMVM